MKRPVWSLPLVLFFLAAPSCPPADSGDADPPAPDGTWFMTCGDPVCQAYTGPFDGVDACSTEQVGDSCAGIDTQCDPANSCNALLQCAESDPATNCPISRAAHKRDIAYLSDSERRALSDQLTDMRLASWQYNWDAADHKPHVGFIIDDVEGSAAVMADGERVDLYGYTSMAVATIQVQQQQIDVLKSELATLRRQVAELKARGESTGGLSQTGRTRRPVAESR